MCIVEFMIGVIAGFVAGWIAFPEPRGDTQFMGARHGLGASHDTSHAVTSCSTWKMLKIYHDPRGDPPWRFSTHRKDAP